MAINFLNTKTATHISQIDLFPTLLELANIDPQGHNDNSAARSFAKSLTTGEFEKNDEVFLEQEETRAIRTPSWLYKRRFQQAPNPPYPDELYDLTNDPLEKTNLVDDPQYAEISDELIRKIERFFGQYSDPKYDLWNGGAPQSNSDKPWLWKEAWGDDWAAGFQKD